MRVQRVHATDDTTDETPTPELDVSIDLELASDLDLGDGNNHGWISRVFYSDVALADDDTGWPPSVCPPPKPLLQSTGCSVGRSSHLNASRAKTPRDGLWKGTPLSSDHMDGEE